MWDLRHARPAVTNFSYPIAAVYRNTEKEPRGSCVVPGRYTVRLTVDGTRYEQPLVVRMDPRVKTRACRTRPDVRRIARARFGADPGCGGN